MYGGRHRVCSWNHWNLLDYAYTHRSHTVFQQTCGITSFDRPTKKKPDYYELLGVRKDATQAEIKAAFYAKSKQLHPDKGTSGESASAFVELKEAYDVLRRPADRRAYDMRDHEYYKHRHRDPYSQFRYQQDRSREWSQFWGQNPGTTGHPDDSPSRKRSQEEWRFILKWTAFGTVLIVLYNLGYIFQMKARERRLAKLIDEDEIAKSFLRQSEFRDKPMDSVEMYELARQLKGDVDEAWRRKVENLGSRNPNEIREEYRWLRAVQDVDHTRRVKAQRAERRRKEALKVLGLEPDVELDSKSDQK
ncbi:DnaJ domain protein [Ancylostoma caninum]|uniref:DnaJ domain protein n=1 Tax=Ancylostoma caninum TaxID=29170 RepID=A0A368GZI2_ANCCA|nr:DnaJ domain protein [Ancylostoma caninum]